MQPKTLDLYTRQNESKRDKATLCCCCVFFGGTRGGEGVRGRGGRLMTCSQRLVDLVVESLMQSKTIIDTAEMERGIITPLCWDGTRERGRRRGRSRMGDGEEGGGGGNRGWGMVAGGGVRGNGSGSGSRTGGAEKGNSRAESGTLD